MTQIAHSESITLGHNTLTQIQSFTNAQVAEVLKEGEQNKLLADVNEEVKNWYKDKKVMAKLIPVKPDIEVFKTYARTNKILPDGGGYELWNNTSEYTYNYYQNEKNSVIRQKKTAPYTVGMTQGYYERAMEQRRANKQGAGYGSSIEALVWMELQDSRMKLVSQQACDALYALATKAPLFDGIGDGISDNMIAFNYGARGALFTPATGKTANVFNPEVHIRTPIAGLEGDIATNPETALILLQRLANNPAKAGGTLYVNHDGKRVFMEIRKAYPELFSNDYNRPLDSNGIASWTTPVDVIFGISIVCLDDLNQGNRVYGTSNKDTGWILDSAIDTSNVFGYYVKGSPITQHIWFDETLSGELDLAKTLRHIFSFDMVDEKEDDRGNVVVIESAYRMATIDRTRGTIQY